MTISRKLILALYKKYDQFNSDMLLMFDNALLYNKKNKVIIKEVTELKKYYMKLFDELDTHLRKSPDEELFPKVQKNVHYALKGVSEVQLEKAMNEGRKEKLGTLLTLLRAETQKKLLSSFEKIHPEARIYEMEGQKTFYLDKLNPL